MSIPYTDISSLYINGEWVAPASGDREDVLNPATEEVIGRAPVGGVEDAGQAIAAARDAFDNGIWPKMSMAERADMVEKFCRAVVADKEALLELIIAETGGPRIMSGPVQFDIPLESAFWAIDYARRMELAKTTPLESATSFLTGAPMVGGGAIIREPVGVVTAITPYNFPLYLNIVKIVPALLMGNTVILKPSPYTPFEALAVAKIADAIGFPEGVINVITGGIEPSELITSDERVDMVTFTGSEAVGTAIMKQAAPTIKKVHLELGGKSALIIREDADLEAAIGFGLSQLSMHSGQGCAIMTRHIVHNSLRNQYVQAVSGMLSQMKIGDPSCTDTLIGPLIRDAARERTERYVALGQQEGATLVCGGKRPCGFDRGFYFEPTLFDNVDNSSAIAQEEIFGPVGAVIGFDTDEEAVAMANDSRYGLHGSIFSGDVKKGYDMALQLRTGGVMLNGGNGRQSGYLPFGGYKRSGIGRELGEGWLEEFSEVKSVSFHLA